MLLNLHVASVCFRRNHFDTWLHVGRVSDCFVIDLDSSMSVILLREVVVGERCRLWYCLIRVDP
jgi:hypothetical protein